MALYGSPLLPASSRHPRSSARSPLPARSPPRWQRRCQRGFAPKAWIRSRVRCQQNPTRRLLCSSFLGSLLQHNQKESTEECSCRFPLKEPTDSSRMPPYWSYQNVPVDSYHTPFVGYRWAGTQDSMDLNPEAQAFGVGGLF